MPEARERYDDQWRRALGSAAENERWHGAMPAGLEPLWPAMMDLDWDEREVAAVLERGYPDPIERCRILFEWRRHGSGSWIVWAYPIYEDVPANYLARMPLNVLVQAAETEPHSPALREGAAPLFATGVQFHKEHGIGVRLPPGLERLLLEHVLESGDDNKRLWALGTFGDSS
jgi:hypothetical protein